jgi:hypothetical protein
MTRCNDHDPKAEGEALQFQQADLPPRTHHPMPLRDFIAERLEAVYGDQISDQLWDLADSVEASLLFDSLNDQIDAAAEATLREQVTAVRDERAALSWAATGFR